MPNKVFTKIFFINSESYNQTLRLCDMFIHDLTLKRTINAPLDKKKWFFREVYFDRKQRLSVSGAGVDNFPLH